MAPLRHQRGIEDCVGRHRGRESGRKLPMLPSLSVRCNMRPKLLQRPMKGARVKPSRPVRNGNIRLENAGSAIATASPTRSRMQTMLPATI